ncbi:MAG: ribonuclease H-like domain-containing protein [Tissierellaceae bacterium]
MEIIRSNIIHPLRAEKYFPENRVTFIDIETTGLDRKREVIYLIGLLYFDWTRESWILNQYFASDLAKEGRLLESFIADLQDFDLLISYNGDSFDLPFIGHRLKKYGLDDKFFQGLGSFDLYRLVRKNNIFLNLPSLKLKSLEQFLGFEREDKYSGLECIGFYYDYMENKDPILRENILKHNFDDLVNMLDTISILDVLDEKKAFSLQFEGRERKFSISAIEGSGDTFLVSGDIEPKIQNNLKYYRDSYSLVTEGQSSFSLTLYYKTGFVSENEKGLYMDTADFPDLSSFENKSPYKLGKNIALLKVGKSYCFENIKSLVKEIFKSIS